MFACPVSIPRAEVHMAHFLFVCLFFGWFIIFFFGCVSERYARGEGIVSILHLRLVPCHWPSLCTFVKHL